MKDYKQALSHFKTADPSLYQVAIQYNLEEMFDYTISHNYFERLCRSIAGQQLSTKAAATIWGRFVDLLPDNQVEPKHVSSLEHETLRSAGLSNAKAQYIQGIATAVLNKEIDLESLNDLENEAVIKELTKLKGVGVWTAEMFLMFTLGRPDIFSTGDLGLKRAIEKLYKLEDPSASQMNTLAEKWSPYRTYACRILWESLDNNPSK